ncbi:flagellar protein FlgN [Sphingomonas sp. S2-65]|uniref:flagellar protein FlgN n=1 Tax=Sphingomonas sp. S2-65 TaxID=2903960 RepID=UPI001F455AAB|nr:flagellar protein FlgN [Sphingomonas sp. S2-65]UYY59681.1 flagellar protein FlgN [Sphingomonas sp. S2-65]
MMTDHLLDAMVSLTSLMEEESEQLVRSPYLPALSEIANAKLRLTGRIEAEVARLKRGNQNWMAALDEEARAQLADVTRHLLDASEVNQKILSRQIELSSDMMAAIATEAKRLTGTRNMTYGACGGMGGMDAPAPISINARL